MHVDSTVTPPSTSALDTTFLPYGAQISNLPSSLINVSTTTSCTMVGSAAVVITSSSTLPSNSMVASFGTSDLSSGTFPSQTGSNNPFILKAKSPRIHICQVCRRNYDGPNDTMQLVAARAERRLVSNITTGCQFLSKESNSHYHVNLNCLKGAPPTFTGNDLIIPDDVKSKLTILQKVYLHICIQVPQNHLV